MSAPGFILVIEAQLAVLSSSKRLLADAGAPAVLATAPDAAMLADAGATAVLAPAPLAVMVADSVLVSPQSLHWPLWRLCWQVLAPPQSMHLLPGPDAVMLADASAPAVLALVPLEVVLDFLAPPPRLRCAHPLSRWKGPQVHWAQQRTGVRRTDSLRTGQARARSSSTSLPGAGAADAGMSFSGSDMA